MGTTLERKGKKSVREKERHKEQASRKGRNRVSYIDIEEKASTLSDLTRSHCC
jgi:hypothetical protein